MKTSIEIDQRIAERKKGDWKKFGVFFGDLASKVARSCEEPQMCAMGTSCEVGQRKTSFFPVFRLFQMLSFPVSGENFYVISRIKKGGKCLVFRVTDRCIALVCVCPVGGSGKCVGVFVLWPAHGDETYGRVAKIG